MIETKCRCGRKMAPEEVQAGKTVVCQTCRSPVKIPAWIRLSCTFCRKGLKVPYRLSEKRVVCPGCGSGLYVPRPEPIRDMAQEKIEEIRKAELEVLESEGSWICQWGVGEYEEDVRRRVDQVRTVKAKIELALEWLVKDSAYAITEFLEEYQPPHGWHESDRGTVRDLFWQILFNPSIGVREAKLQALRIYLVKHQGEEDPLATKVQLGLKKLEAEA